LNPEDISYISKIKSALPKVKIMISIGGWGNDGIFAPIARNPTAQQQFSRNLKALLDKYDFAGIDLVSSKSILFLPIRPRCRSPFSRHQP
jgi:GH18 family chitinase